MQPTDRIKPTLEAWNPLHDAIRAAGMLDEVSADDPRWRIYWTAALTLLRAVGHVLAKVDAAARPELAPVIGQLWATWKAERPRPFAFIGDERNRILKQYRFAAFSEVEIAYGDGGKPLCDEEGYYFVHETGKLVLDNERGAIIAQGGEWVDAGVVLDECVKWWLSQLWAIERDSQGAQR